eukprot:3293497-Pleurochrysis_carterae.AAC.5
MAASRQETALPIPLLVSAALAHFAGRSCVRRQREGSSAFDQQGCEIHAYNVASVVRSVALTREARRRIGTSHAARSPRAACEGHSAPPPGEAPAAARPSIPTTSSASRECCLDLLRLLCCCQNGGSAAVLDLTRFDLRRSRKEAENLSVIQAGEAAQVESPVWEEPMELTHGMVVDVVPLLFA